MRVDFYQSDVPPEAIVPLLARRALGEGGRLLVVESDPETRDRIAEALWAAPGAFLANGLAGGGHDARQPVLIAGDDDLPGDVQAANGARLVVFADGVWRTLHTDDFDRAFLIFDADTIAAARALWRAFASSEGMELNFWARREGRWIRLR